MFQNKEISLKSIQCQFFWHGICQYYGEFRPWNVNDSIFVYADHDIRVIV